MPSLGLGLGTHIPRRVLGGFTGLLDTYGGAAAAYSLRKLSSTYSGSAVRVRESGGNTEADIGFNADGTLDTTALLAHCGANDGFVRTWYDQSGNARDAEQATTTDQLQIVNAGSLINNANGFPSLKGNGTSSSMDITAALQAAIDGTDKAFSLISVYDFPATSTAADRIISSTGLGSSLYLYPVNTANFRVTKREIAGTLKGSPDTAASTTGTSLTIATDSGTSGNLRNNGAAVYTGYDQDVGEIDISTGLLMTDRTASFSNSYLSELIIYPSDQTANVSGLESNIADRYGITLP